MRVMEDVTESFGEDAHHDQERTYGWKNRFKALVSEDRDFLRQLICATLREVLEAEMTEALGAAKSERTAGRNGYRSGYYGRSLITRVGKPELRIPQDRTGQFSTELFARYQRSERALVAALAEM
jgi:putative transposase